MSQSYDEILYEGQSHPESHPDMLYAVGRFMGLSPPNFETARILELGTGCGINALSMASRFPKATILALDNSQQQIQFAAARARKLGVTNLTYAERSLEDLTEADGHFDYIVCYGLFSWINRELQIELLRVCHERLAPNGLAFFNYNVMPGWGAPSAVRELIRFHHRLRPNSRDQAFIARDAAALLGDGLRSAKGAHVAALQDEILHIKRSPDYYLVHEYLSPDNIAVYFHEFLDQAQTAGLNYVGDAHLQEMFPTEYRQKFRQRLMNLGSIEQTEQYLDFMRGRRFRSSIMCRSDGPAPNHAPVAERCTGLYISCMDSAAQDDKLFPALGRSSGQEAQSETERPEALKMALLAAVSRQIGRVAITREGVLDWADISNVKPEDLDEALADHLIELIKRGDVMLHGSCPDRPEPIDTGTDIASQSAIYSTSYPVASRLARLQIAEGQRWVSSRTGDVVNLDKRSRQLLGMMDGGRTLEDITAAFIAGLQASGWTCRKDGELLERIEDILAFIGPQVAQACESFRRIDLLERIEHK